MARRTILATIIGMTGLFMIAALVAAQQPAMPGHMPSMETMMKECQTHCQETTASSVL